jgi:hypothetical protein
MLMVGSCSTIDVRLHASRIGTGPINIIIIIVTVSYGRPISTRKESFPQSAI